MEWEDATPPLLGETVFVGSPISSRGLFVLAGYECRKQLYRVETCVRGRLNQQVEAAVWFVIVLRH